MKILTVLAAFLILHYSLLYSQSAPHNIDFTLYKLSKEILTNKPIRVLAKGDIGKIQELEKHYNYNIELLGSSIVEILIQPAILDTLLRMNIVRYLEYNPRKQINTLSHKNSFFNQANNAHSENLKNQAKSNSNVIMGIIDTGLDITHPDFKDQEGNSRIVHLWDQNDTTSICKDSDAHFGRVWTNAEINQGECTHKDPSFSGHGTAVTGIIASNGKSSVLNGFKGCVPGADIIFVAINQQLGRASLAAAIHFIVQKANSLDKPCVINYSMGQYSGSHDATDLETKLIEEIISNNKKIFLVAAAGNNGKQNHHIMCSQGAREKSIFFFNPCSSKSPGEIDLYGDNKDVSDTEIQLTIGNSDGLFNISSKKYKVASILNLPVHDSIQTKNKNFIKYVILASLNPYNVINVRLKFSSCAQVGTCGLILLGKSKFHCWSESLIEESNIIHSPFNNYRFLKPDNMYSIAGNVQSSQQVITVGNLKPKDSTFRYPLEQIAKSREKGNIWHPTSSSGPNRLNHKKPDILLIGESIITCKDMNAGLNEMLTFDDRLMPHANQYYTVFGGTSASAALMSGYIGMLLQDNPRLNWKNIKSLVKKFTL